MQLGFVTAILPELSLEDVLSFAATEGYRCIEVMCWPVGKAERRYAGVTHLDVTSVGERELGQTQEFIAKHGVWLRNASPPVPQYFLIVADQMAGSAAFDFQDVQPVELAQFKARLPRLEGHNLACWCH